MKKQLKEKPAITLTDVNIGSTVESCTKFLGSQKDLFHTQVDQLQNIVVTQCRLTGANPLSQEMAAGVLSINIGKRPKDLLNPKGVKYMQSVFSIKDTITKKETREISALCGVTVTQVREYFAGQRSRVRKLVRLSREKAVKVDAVRMSQGECTTSSDTAMHVIDPTPLNSVNPHAISSDAEKMLQGGCLSSTDPAMHVINPVPLNSVGDAPPCLFKEETVPGADDFEKNFIENIFNFMRKEETFSGQVKLMEWILQVQNSSVLYWFVTKGGLMMLAAWLNEAALEEQTTALRVIFQVLCHLPLHKALPLQMSAILQTVNRLRFYRTSDISTRAKVLLSRWSKIFVKSQALKKPFSNFGIQKEKNLRQSDVLSSEWQSDLGLPEDILSLALDSSETCRNSEASPALKLLQASSDDSNKKQTRTVSSAQTKERRQVQMMEHPGRNTNNKSPHVIKPMNSNQGRPMSADDIQKAKLRATFMQSKYGKTGAAHTESRYLKKEDLNKSSISQISQMHSPSKPPNPPVRHVNEESKLLLHPSEISPSLPGSLKDSVPTLGPDESPWVELKRDKIPWHRPPEITMKSDWRVSVGENSKEVGFQTGRIRREKETIYQRLQDIPANPKEPWDLEMDYDDTLTLQIPIEQAPEEFPTERAPEDFSLKQTLEEFPTKQAPDLFEAPLLACNAETTSVTLATTTGAPIINNENAQEPDLELLAVLLKNPELVFALQGGNISSEDTMKLLDLIKNTGGDLTGFLNAFNGSIIDEPSSIPSPTPHSLPSPTPTSFPSPTPPSERVVDERRSEVSNNCFPQPLSAANREAYVYPPAAPTDSSSVGISATDLVHYQTQTNNLTSSAQYQTQTPKIPEQQNHDRWVNNVESFHSVLDPHPHSNSVASGQERQFLQMNQNSNLMPYTFNPQQQNYLAGGNPKLQQEPMSSEQVSLQPEAMNYGQMQTVVPAPISIVLNLPDGRPITLPPLMPNQQSHHLPDHSLLQPMQPEIMQWDAPNSGRHNQMSNTRGGRQRRYDDSGSNSWSQPNQNGYNSFHGEHMHPYMPNTSNWDRNDPMVEPDLETYSPGRNLERSRSPDYRLGRNHSQTRRDYSRNPRPDWSRRRDSGRRDHKQGNRRWRDRRYY